MEADLDALYALYFAMEADTNAYDATVAADRLWDAAAAISSSEEEDEDEGEDAEEGIEGQEAEGEPVDEAEEDLEDEATLIPRMLAVIASRAHDSGESAKYGIMGASGHASSKWTYATAGDRAAASAYLLVPGKRDCDKILFAMTHLDVAMNEYYRQVKIHYTADNNIVYEANLHDLARTADRHPFRKSPENRREKVEVVFKTMAESCYHDMTAAGFKDMRWRTFFCVTNGPHIVRNAKATVFLLSLLYTDSELKEELDSQRFADGVMGRAILAAIPVSKSWWNTVWAGTEADATRLRSWFRSKLEEHVLSDATL
ncbi:hypothetical protein BDV96DRAFT_648169 [Lophiotrema nucula]|uniref:Uncharacterized protein n=1 Tax=Lophiotrema nucula TaxID=690887 RepID=A0A6A5Z2V8_9PLEO|nr:hypothetical protein BDV96DRAFT_648169 [Lophiotrema nucula]